MESRLSRWGFELVVPGLYSGIVCRTRKIDEAVKQAVSEGAVQYVILGAGYDTRAHRLGVPANVNVFEVDKPDIQRFKQKKISKLELESNARVIYVPVDFNTQSLEEELRKSEGYDPKAKTVMTLEGVSYYIPRESVASTIKAMGELCGKGSTFVLSYADKDTKTDPAKVCHTDNKRGPKGLKRLMHAVSRMGEPWVNFFDQGEVLAFFTSLGWVNFFDQGEVLAFFTSLGFTLYSDESSKELNSISIYFTPKGREILDSALCYWERFAVTIKN